jgi:D-glycero-D-manno-heptose 1,7-bisphosphate phosphatase
MSRFVFLDRDGTLVRDRGYTHRIEDYELLPGVVSGLRRLLDSGYRLAGISNQSGIGRGYYSAEQYAAFQAHLAGDLARQGIPIDGSYFCPHRPEANCECRKPRPALLHRAERELGADLARSWVIGDSTIDVELAQRGGCRGAVRILTGTNEPSGKRKQLLYSAPSFEEAAEIVLRADQRAP